MTEQVNIRVTGKVQDVFFRQTTRETARRLGISGWVRNEPDGAVYIEAQGTEAAMADFIAWCQEGPAQARVDAVTVDKTALQAPFDGFHIRY